MTNATLTDIDWLLDDLVERVRGAERAVVLSADGLLKGRSTNLPTPDAEHLSAAASAFHSLARGTGRHFGGGEVYQTIVEMQRAFLLVTAVETTACVAVIASAEADLGMIAYETNMLVTKVGTHLAPGARQATDEPAQQKTA